MTWLQLQFLKKLDYIQHHNALGRYVDLYPISLSHWHPDLSQWAYPMALRLNVALGNIIVLVPIG